MKAAFCDVIYATNIVPAAAAAATFLHNIKMVIVFNFCTQIKYKAN